MSKPGWERSTVKSAWGDTNLLILQYLEGYLPIRTKWHGHDASSSNFPILDNPVKQERFIFRGVFLFLWFKYKNRPIPATLESI